MITTPGVRIIKPNIQQIVKMRNGKPPHHSRPSELTKIAVADDFLDMANSVAEPISYATRLNITRLHSIMAAPPDEQETSEIVVASSGEEIAVLADFTINRKIDMLITDNDMYRDDQGVAITSELRNNGYTGWIFGMTGRPKNVGAFIDAGADLAFPKNFDQKTLLSLFVLK